MLVGLADKGIAQCYGAEPAAQELSFAVVPQFPPTTIYESWIPVLLAVGEKIDVCFHLKVEENIPEFERELANGNYDLAYVNPFHSIMAKEMAGYTPQIVDGARLLTGIIVVRKDSEFTNIRDLDGKILVVPAPNAFGASLLNKKDLEKQNIDVDVKYARTHSNVYRHVAKGIADAGGGVNNTFQKENNDLRSQLRILHETRGHPSHPIVSHESISKKITSAFNNAFLELSSDKETLSNLRTIQIPVPRIANYDADYKHLEPMYFEMFPRSPKK
jgi:phosphonate transport system substrate-binding protein